MARARHGTYIFQRPGSSNWWVKVRSGGKRIEKSLGTPDRADAEIIALRDFIPDHKERLRAARPRLEWRHKFEPGREHVGEDGGRIIATDKELIYIGPNGAITGTEHNLQSYLSSVPRLGLPVPVPIATTEAQRPTLAAKNCDDAILELYLQHSGIGEYSQREARTVWALFRKLTNGNPLKDCTRDDGRLLVQHFENKGNKTATIHKKVTWLNAAVNFAIKEGTLRFNPFSGIVPKVDDAERRFPLDDTDMKACRKNLDMLSKPDQLLFRLLACTGMRLGEAFGISGESTERGVRFCIVGTKTEASKRRVPFPAAVLPYLPKKITGPLFQGDAPHASKRLNRFLRDSGITAPGKVVHSLRHRAADRLRAAGAPVDIRHALLGHETRSVAEGYGAGHPVVLLKKWVDKIGF